MTPAGCDFVPKSDAQAILASIERRGLREVWHLTWLSQLPQIFELGGLLSRTELDVLGVTYEPSSWGSPQKADEMKPYVCGSIVPPWGMSRNQSERKALISMEPLILCKLGTLFSGGVHSTT